MSQTQLPINTLPAWALLNDVSFIDAKIQNIGGKGFGIVADRNLTTEGETFDVPTLLSVPHGLILNAEAVEEYAKQDKNFRQLVDAVGHKSTRHDILVFLMAQLLLSAKGGLSSAGVSNPWTQYIKFLPGRVPLPTLWTENERLLLSGTSLEAALMAKLSALNQELAEIQDKSAHVPVWSELLSGPNTISLRDWTLLDAWYRSRCLELPKSGESMVPCIDMANHASSPNAHYDEDDKYKVVLLLRPNTKVLKGEEITISYGEQKPSAEMLFSYGFVDSSTAAEHMTLPLDPFSDDPLAKAKLHVFGAQPTVELIRADGRMTWRCPFAYLMCVNEEDGLEFRVLQDVGGTRQLRLFWREEDVTDRARSMNTFLQETSMAPIFQLRVATVVEDRLLSQLDKMKTAGPLDPMHSPVDTRKECVEAAALLMQVETRIVTSALKALEEEKMQLLRDSTVQAYLALMENTGNELVGDEASNGEDDFS